MDEKEREMRASVLAARLMKEAGEKGATHQEMVDVFNKALVWWSTPGRIEQVDRLVEIDRELSEAAERARKSKSKPNAKDDDDAPSAAPSKAR
jgi:hypothetical protein